MRLAPFSCATGTMHIRLLFPSDLFIRKVLEPFRPGQPKEKIAKCGVFWRKSHDKFDRFVCTGGENAVA
jgi:hypothetical protein